MEIGGNRTFVYDRAGNLVQQTKLSTGEVRDFDYDALNRLVTMRQDGVLMARYAYDVLSRRIAKRVYSSASDGVPGYTRFIYHGDNVAFQADSAGTIGLKFTWGLGTDDLRAVQDAGGQNYYVVQDKLGSVRGLFERNGTWRASVRFNPYGDVVAIDSAGSRPPIWYAWTGREFDEETGWFYHRARYYSPLVRRFVQEDPIGYGGGTNLYAYVEGQVLEATDPSGTRMKEIDVQSAIGSAGNSGMPGRSFGSYDMEAVFGAGAGHIPGAQARARLDNRNQASQKATTAQTGRSQKGRSAAGAQSGNVHAGTGSERPPFITAFGIEPNLNSRQPQNVVQFRTRVTSLLEGTGTFVLEMYDEFGIDVRIYSFDGHVGYGLLKTRVTGTVANWRAEQGPMEQCCILSYA